MDAWPGPEPPAEPHSPGTHQYSPVTVSSHMNRGCFLFYSKFRTQVTNIRARQRCHRRRRHLSKCKGVDFGSSAAVCLISHAFPPRSVTMARIRTLFAFSEKFCRSVSGNASRLGPSPIVTRITLYTLASCHIDTIQRYDIMSG